MRQSGSAHVIGSPAVRRNGDTLDYFNSAYLLDPKGEALARYDKAHLVPFGEYVPFRKWLPFLGKIVAQVGDFQAGPPGGVLEYKDHRIGPLICYDGIFPVLARAAVDNGADLLVNLTNDAWYGITSAPYQHLVQYVFRAVETRRSLVRAIGYLMLREQQMRNVHEVIKGRMLALPPALVRRALGLTPTQEAA